MTNFAERHDLSNAESVEDWSSAVSSFTWRPTRECGIRVLLLRVAVDGLHRTAFQCYISGAAVGRIIPQDCIRSEYDYASQKHGFYSPHDRSVESGSIALS